ncbi:tRNA threonylcarbamoyladenosine biosynthesis protein RimN [Pseudoteredinibacter isoporae]|nr:Sua5/YciO/YrdC/YwlC family protein [Pseudoteredinibacter isoporae]NHO85729.1 tRNA threonylcarbamoyladenosine biosynthesis protein RimN [Pseudoteredinibacter isoporae]NIB25819.1 tRNA threonylcarbamoyladenosine biosynthesis protein RimN [Pseudoteredinibacter isoporae]
MQGGGVIAYPTEAVWGLGCDPFQQQAVEKILWLKGRAQAKGLILVAADIEQFEPFLAGISPTQLEQLNATWPGPNTWLVPVNGYCPKWISGRFDSVALRVSAHPVVAGLCKAFGGPIVSTSANPQGLPPALNTMQAERYFHGCLDGLAPGLVNTQANPSTIRDLSSGELIRA